MFYHWGYSWGKIGSIKLLLKNLSAKFEVFQNHRYCKSTTGKEEWMVEILYSTINSKTKIKVLVYFYFLTLQRHKTLKLKYVRSNSTGKSAIVGQPPRTWQKSHNESSHTCGHKSGLGFKTSQTQACRKQLSITRHQIS